MIGDGGIRIYEAQSFAGAGLATLTTERVPPGFTYRLQRIAYEGDKTTSGGNTRARVYVDGHGPKFYLHETDAPAADTLYTITDQVTLAAGERLALEWDQAQAATILRLYAVGDRGPGGDITP